MRLLPVDVGVVGVCVVERGAAVGHEVVEDGVVAVAEDVAGEGAEEPLLVDLQAGHVTVGDLLGADGVVHTEGKEFCLMGVQCHYACEWLCQRSCS